MLNSEKIGEIWKKSNLNSEKIWKIWKLIQSDDRIQYPEQQQQPPPPPMTERYAPPQK